MNATNRMELLLEGLDCANCAMKIEQRVRSLEGIKEANLSFVTKALHIDLENKSRSEEILSQVKDIVKRLEPDVEVKYENNLSNPLKDENSAFHEHEEHGSSIIKKKLIPFLLGALLLVSALVLDLNRNIELALYIMSFLSVGGEVLLRSIKNIMRGQVFDENFLMSIATIGAFAIGEYPEGVAVMLFYQIGEFFQDAAVNHSRKSIKALMDIRPDYANLISDNKEIKTSPDSIEPGDMILVKPGERIPLDGVIINGSTTVDTSTLTGESVPRELTIGDNVLSGSINKNGVVTIEVTKSYGESTVSKILELVQNASSKKSPTENFITKFARYYTPVVVLIAAALAIIPPLIITGASFSEWFYRALVFLVVSCPCALVISIPLGFFGGIGGASRNGILIKGGNYLEALNYADTVIFDKTGTLTKGVFKVTELKAYNGYTEEELLEYAAHAESFSSHPIALSIQKSFGKEINKNDIVEYKEFAGLGVSAIIKNKRVLVGKSKLLQNSNIEFTELSETGTVAYVAVDETYIGYLVISDEIKEDSKLATDKLRKLGVSKIVMLTGDVRNTAEKVAEALGIDEVYAELLPHEKAERLSELERIKKQKSKLIFVGDGINDAPVIAQADIGIAMGALGSDAAIEAADIVLMTDEPLKLASALKIAKFTRRIVWQNIIFAFLVKAVVLVLGAGGIASMWEAVFADVGVALLAVINAARVLNVKE